LSRCAQWAFLHREQYRPFGILSFSSAALTICHLRGFPVSLAHAVDSGVEVAGSAGIQQG
jgi:hypothetical protein